MGRRHHVNVAFHRQIARTGLAAGIGAIEDDIVFRLQEGRVFQRHRPADMVIGGRHLRPGKAKMGQQIEGGIVQLLCRNAQTALAEILSQRPLVEDKADVKGRRQRSFDLFDLTRAKTMADQRGVVDAGAIAQAAVANRIGDDLGNLRLTIAKRFQRRRNRAVDDLEIAATRQFLELHQREVRLDSRRVAIHDQTDGAGRGHDGGLGVAVAVLFAQPQRGIPGLARQGDQARLRAVAGIQRHGCHVDTDITGGVAHRRAAVVADHPQHVVGIAGIARESAQFPGHFGRGGIGHTGHDCRQRATQRPALRRVIAKAHRHQQPTDVGIAQAQRAEVVGPLRDFPGRELRHQDRDFQRHGPKPRRMDIAFGIESRAVLEGQQVHRRQIAGRVIQEHVFRTGVRSTDRTIRRAGVPGVDRVVELDAGVGTGPGGMTDLIPQLSCLDGFGHLSVGTADQAPVGVIPDRLQEGIGDAHRVVRILARNGDIGLGIPVGVIGGEFDAGIALTRILQDAPHIGFRDHRLLGRPDRGLQAPVLCRISGICFSAIPGFDRGEDLVQLGFVDLRSGDQRGHFLFFDDFPVDEGLDIGVIHIADHHLCRTACGAARFDGTRCPVADLEEAHQARRLPAA